MGSRSAFISPSAPWSTATWRILVGLCGPSLLLAALVTLTASFASTPSPSPCDRETMATDASGEYSCGARIEWLKSNDGLTDWWAHEQVAQENPNPNLTRCSPGVAYRAILVGLPC